jgi:UDP-2-acetamido-3-amino-2,3-dideoxy-glucuronate N-acetyltransferase
MRLEDERARRYFVHDSAYVDEPCIIGDGTKIWHFSHVMAGSHIGADCTIGQNVFIASNVRIGNRVKIQNNVSIYEGVELEDDVFCGPSMVFTNIITPRSAWPRNGPEDYVRTIVRRGATIGANATIVCGCEIGEYGFVGAGSVVTKNVLAYGMVYGNPARIAGHACQCGTKLIFGDGRSATCALCGKAYEKHGMQVGLARSP